MALSDVRRIIKKGTKSGGKYSALKGGILLLFFAVLIVGYYFYLNNRQNQISPPDVKMTVAQELISRNLTTNYPATPKEVMRFYSDITKCFYNEEYSDEELEQLASQTRMLYDDDLAAINDWARYLVQLKEEITYYKENSIRVSGYNISAATDVDYFTEDGYDFARLHCTYTLKSRSKKQPIEEVFLLRKDEAGHWRIYGWDLAENVTIEE